MRKSLVNTEEMQKPGSVPIIPESRVIKGLE